MAIEYRRQEQLANCQQRLDGIDREIQARQGSAEAQDAGPVVLNLEAERRGVERLAEKRNRVELLQRQIDTYLTRFGLPVTMDVEDAIRVIRETTVERSARTRPDTKPSQTLRLDQTGASRNLRVPRRAAWPRPDGTAGSFGRYLSWTPR